MRHLLFVALLLQGCGSSNTNPYGDGGPVDMVFVPPDYHDAGPPPIQLCKIVTGAGCPTGQHCTAGRLNGVSADLCIPDPEKPISEGGHCTPINIDGSVTGDLCTPGLVCSGAAGVSRCRKPCFRHADCSATQACSGSTSSPTTKPDPMMPTFERPLSACVEDERCDPVAQTGCFDPSTRCAISRADDKKRVTVCGYPGSLGHQPPGSVCGSSADCAPGIRCSGLGFCAQLCYQDAPSGAPFGSCTNGIGICSPIFGAGGHYGECD